MPTTPRLRVLAALCSLTALACGDAARAPTAPLSLAPPGRPATEIVDGLHGAGNSHFYFLPPLLLLPAPTQPPAGTGTFDGTLSPEVRICAWDGVRCPVGVDGGELLVARFTDGVAVYPELQSYAVVWRTQGAGLRNGAVYRIRVLVAGTELGHTDVAVVRSLREAGRVDLEQYFPLINGLPLPISFRIEQGAVYVASPAGGTLSAGDGAVTISVPAGATTQSVGLTVFPSASPPSNPRLIAGTAWDFGPAGTTFASPVSLTLRYDPAAVPAGSEGVLRLVQIVDSRLVPVAGSSVDVASHTVTGAVSHFSTYAVAAVPVSSVSVSPSSLTLDAGGSAGLDVTVADADGNLLTDRAITAASTDDGVAQASVATNALVNVTAAGPGSADVTVSSEGVSSTPVPVTVRAAGVASIRIELSPDDMFAPPEPGATLHYTATALDALGASMPGETVTWSLSSPGGAAAVEGIDGNSITVDALALGSATLFASIGSVTGMQMIFVSSPMIQRVELSPMSGSMTVGSITYVRATAYSARGFEVPLQSVSWTVNGSSTLTLGTSGPAGNTISVQGTSAGSSLISASVTGAMGSGYGSSGMASVSVTPYTPCSPTDPACGPGQMVASITGVPLTIDLRVGQSLTFTARTLDTDGQVLPYASCSVLVADGAVMSWGMTTNGGDTIITIGGVAPGTRTLQVRCGQLSDTLPVTVSP